MSLHLKSFFAFLFILFFRLVSSALVEAAETPIQVHGDAVEYFHTEQKVEGIGHVLIDYENVKLSADKITVYTATKVAVAEGNVTLVQKGSTFTGQRAEYDFAKKVGNVSQMSAVIEPSYFGKAKSIEKLSENHYRARDSYITTCCGDSPFYRIQAQQVDIYPNEKVVAKNAVMYVKNVPILFIPYFVTYFIDFKRFPAQLTPGKNKEWGAFLLSKWRYHLANRPDLQSKGNVLLDTRERRGFGGGVENFFRGDAIGRGGARVYYIDDHEPPVDTDAERYRVQWRHQLKITESTALTTEINKLSDATVIKDFFFREEYERDVFPDNYVSLVTSKPEYTFSVLARERLDDFFSVVERSPELRFDTHNRQFSETPFYLRQETQFSNLRKRFVDTDASLDATRLDSNFTLLYAGHVGNMSVTPRVGTRQTYYSRDVNGDTDHIRSAYDPGVDISMKFYKTYDVAVKAWGLDYNQIRHIFTPTVSYFYRQNPTVSATTLQPFDSLDALDKQNFMRFNFENKFQTKNHSGANALVTREIARVIPFLNADYHTGHLENVGIDAELRPYPWMGIEADATYDSRTRDFNTANFDFNVGKSNYNFGVGQSYVQNESSQTTAQIRWKIREDLEIKAYERYEFEENKSKEFEATVSKAFYDCIIVDFTYNHSDGDTFYFTFRLKAFPEAAFGLSQSYRRPKASPRFSDEY